MMPNNRLSDVPIRSALLSPDSWETSSRLDFERGGIALANPSLGINAFDWKAWIDDDFNFWINRVDLPDDNATFLFQQRDARNIRLAFDRNMNVAIAYQKYSNSYLYWFDSVPNAYVTSLFGGASQPRLTHDDKRADALDTSDVLFFYMIGRSLRYRQQRDRYTIERTLASVPPDYEFESVGMGLNNRLQFHFRPI